MPSDTLFCPHLAPWLAVPCACLFVLACGDDGTAGGTGGTGGTGGSGVQVGPPPVACDAGAYPYVPTPEDVGFTPMAEVPRGEQILYNDWSLPDQVKSMAPDGSGVVTIFSVYRVWSMGVSRARDRLAFACGDPLQLDHYGVSLGDAIQNTFIYDFDSQAVVPVGCGNVNDECHHFGPGDEDLYVCRRHDFAADPPFDNPYRIGRLTPHLGAFEWLTADEPMQHALNPQVTADGSNMWFSLVTVSGGTQSRSILRVALPDGAPEQMFADAYRPKLSPDGERILFADVNQQSSLFSARLDGSDLRPLVNKNGTSASWSPDGQRVAYLIWDDAAVCAHVEVVMSDGSQADSPTRIVDCSQTGESITNLAWFVRP